MATPDLDALADLATEVATDAARLLLDGLGRARAEVRTKSSGTDMVTEMDRAAEAQIVAALAAARPDDAVVAEEGGGSDGTSGVRWVVDPLDGTTNYLYGYPGFCVSVAAEIDGRVEVGVVADALHGEVFRAVRDRGATRNGSPIACTDQDDPADALVATGFAYDATRRGAQAEVLSRVLPRIRDVRRGGAAAVDLCWVACGRLDAFYERGLQWWDLAAGILIAEEAGARTGDLDGGPAGPHFTLAAAPAVFDPLRAILAEAGAATA